MESMAQAYAQAQRITKADPMKVRTDELTPAQRRAVMFAQQQIVKAQEIKCAKEERQAELERRWQLEDEMFDKKSRKSAPAKQTKQAKQDEDAAQHAEEASLRGAIGEVLRELRTNDNKTLREVSEKAGVSLGYLSEVERGQKEASTELLSSIAVALGVTTPGMLRMVADHLEKTA